MKTPGVLPIAAVLVALAATAGVSASRAAETPPRRLTIAFTGDVAGYLEPCG